MLALWKASRGFVPGSEPLQADRQVEPAHGVLRLHLRERTVAAGGLLEVAQLELDVAHGTIDFRCGVPFGDGALELFQGLIALACQMQGDGAGQVSRSTGSGDGRRLRIG